MSGPRVVVGLSGGVDSSVAALLLKQQGYEVIGLFMKNWEDDEHCSAREDLVDAVSVADRLDMEVDAVNFAAEYRERVFANFLHEYRAGRTPNPDVLCNSEIKFRCFLDHALGLGAELIATGHYARIRRRDGMCELLRAVDDTKDQSYFLHRLTQEQLSRTCFPLGELRKTEVREIARRARLPTHAKKDSTGICFIGERPFRDFLSRYLPREPGEIHDLEGRLVGRHEGLMYYTIGQRQGLGIGGPGQPWFVVGKDLDRNVLQVVQGHDHPALLRPTLHAIDTSWIAGVPPPGDTVLGAKTRYRQKDSPCRIAGWEDDGMDLAFSEPQWAVTPGQSAVIYAGDVCLGGGIISA